MHYQNELYHYGMPERSGRYPWGSGDRPYQRLKKTIKKLNKTEYKRQQLVQKPRSVFTETDKQKIEEYSKKFDIYMDTLKRLGVDLDKTEVKKINLKSRHPVLIDLGDGTSAVIYTYTYMIYDKYNKRQ